MDSPHFSPYSAVSSNSMVVPTAPQTVPFSPNINWLHLSSYNTVSSNSMMVPTAPQAALFRPIQQAPIFMSPNPSGLGVGCGNDNLQIQNRHNSHQISCSPPGPRSRRPENSRARKISKRKPMRRKHRDQTYYEQILTSPYTNDQERLLVRLRHVDHLSWKEVKNAFSQVTGCNMEVAALQMRLGRLCDRIDERRFHDSAENALHMYSC